MYSVNYESVLINRNRDKTTAQVGFSYYPPFTGNIKFWMPITASELYSFSKEHHIEFGVGCVFAMESYYNPDNESVIFGACKLGYLYLFKEGKHTFKAAFTPLFEFHALLKNIGFIPLGGVSFGYNF